MRLNHRRPTHRARQSTRPIRRIWSEVCGVLRLLTLVILLRLSQSHLSGATIVLLVPLCWRRPEGRRLWHASGFCAPRELHQVVQTSLGSCSLSQRPSSSRLSADGMAKYRWASRTSCSCGHVVGYPHRHLPQFLAEKSGNLGLPVAHRFLHVGKGRHKPVLSDGLDVVVAGESLPLLHFAS